MFKENAELLIEGKNVYKEMPERIKKKKLFKLF
jgi:protein-tyrosine phosphatase